MGGVCIKANQEEGMKHTPESTTPKEKSWEQEFDEEFIGRFSEVYKWKEGAIKGLKDTFLKGRDIDKIKTFISKVEQEAYEKGKEVGYQRLLQDVIDKVKGL